MYIHIYYIYIHIPHITCVYMHTYAYTYIYIHIYIACIYIHIPKAMKRQWRKVSKIIFTYFKNLPSRIGKTADAEAEQTVTVEARRGNRKAELPLSWLPRSLPSSSSPTPSLPFFTCLHASDPYAHGRTIYWSMGSLSATTYLKKTDSAWLSSHQLLTAFQLRIGFLYPCGMSAG